jgi:hypothetical protein
MSTLCLRVYLSHPVLWHSVPLSLLSGYPVTSFPFLPLLGAVVCCPFLEFAVEAHSLTVWATERHMSILSSKFIYVGFWFRKSSLPRFIPVGQALRDLVCLYLIHILLLLIYLLFAKFSNCIFCKVLLLNTIYCLFHSIIVIKWVC